MLILELSHKLKDALKTIDGDNAQDIAIVPIPKLPKHCTIENVQKYISGLKYNHFADPFYKVNKQSNVYRLSMLSKEIIKTALPIKCLEAVVLAMYLTTTLFDCTRIPMSFTSVCNGRTHRHIVLIVKQNGKWGCLGLSRKSDLMYKPVMYSTLSDLVKEFADAYARNQHWLEKVKIGKPVTHHHLSNEFVNWKYFITNVDSSWDQIATKIDFYAKQLK
jgi:hypothetical protein